MARPALIVAWILGPGALACTDPDQTMIQCNGELLELIAWRDAVERELRAEPGRWTPNTLAAEEKRRVEATADTIRARRAQCDRSWEMLMYQPPSNPGLRLREEALLRVLDGAPHDYPPQSVGYAGVSTSGRAPIVGLELR